MFSVKFYVLGGERNGEKKDILRVFPRRSSFGLLSISRGAVHTRAARQKAVGSDASGARHGPGLMRRKSKVA